MRITNITALFLVMSMGMAGCDDDRIDLQEVVDAEPVIEPVYGDQSEINKECTFVLGMSSQFQDKVNYTDTMEKARVYFLNQVQIAEVTGQQIIADYLPRYSENNDIERLDLKKIEYQAVKCAYSPMMQR